MRVSEKIFAVRQQAAEMFGAQTENVAFTANCTHALNMAIKGVMQYGGHMIISDHEHNAVARPVYALSKTRGVKYSIARTGETDSETVENFRRLITPETKCICCTVASNVTGRLMPYRELAVLCKAHGICFIADGAQAAGFWMLLSQTASTFSAPQVTKPSTDQQAQGFLSQTASILCLP